MCVRTSASSSQYGLLNWFVIEEVNVVALLCAEHRFVWGFVLFADLRPRVSIILALRLSTMDFDVLGSLMFKLNIVM